MMKKQQQGGKRKKSGRKPIDDKKTAVTIYVRESVIEKMGLEVLKETCYKAIDKTI